MSLVENRESATRDAPGFFHGLKILVKPRLALQNAMDHPVNLPVFFDLNGYFD